MRNTIDKMLPEEEKAFYAEFDAKLERKRLALKNFQDEELKRLDEKLKGTSVYK